MRGFSILEVILAVALFLILTTGGLGLVVQSYNANRLGAEFTVATQFASEGIEAVKSIKNQAYSNLTIPNASPRGVTRVSNLWAFEVDGTNDTLTHNSTDNFIRTINVESVNRNSTPPNGDIVSSGGTLDPDTKKITSTVTWNFNTARPETISLVTYLSDWEKPLSITGDGLLVYGRASNNIPRVNFYSNSDNTFGANTDTVTGAAGRNFVIKASPTKQEAIVGYVDSSTLRVMCFDGTTWANEWNVPVGGTGTTRRFDIAYEHQSGDVMVLYSTDAGTNELDYQTKSGSLGCGSANWVDQAAFDSPDTNGVVTWIKLSADNRAGSNVLAASWADMNRNLQTAIWDGASWTQRTTALETTLECRGNCNSSPTIPNGDSFDIDFEASSGHIMVAWGSGGSGTANGAWYNKCDGAAPPACTWNGSRTAITNMSNDATSLDISSNPNSDEILFASIGDGGSDLQAARWSGSSWVGTDDLDTSALKPVTGSSLVATGWLINGATTRGIVIFANSGAQSQRIHGFAWDGSSFVRQGTDSTPWFTPAPLFGAPNWYDIQTDPKNKDKLMFLVSNSSNDLFAKRLEMSSTGTFTWSDPTYTDGTSIEADLVQGTTSPFYFGYWRNP